MDRWRAGLVERVARRLCELDGTDPDDWQGYMDDAQAALSIAIPAILERAAGDDIRSKIKDVLHAYRADSGDFIHHPGPYADRILAAIRSLKDTPDVEA